MLRAIEREVLDPQVVEAALALALDQLTRPDAASAARRGALRTELERIEGELARYAAAIADAVPRPPDWPPAKGPGRRAKLVYEVVGEASLSRLFKQPIPVSLVVTPTGHDQTHRIHVRDIIGR